MIDAAFRDELFDRFPANLDGIGPSRDRPVRTHGVDWTSRGVIGLLKATPAITSRVPPGHAPVLLKKGSDERMLASIYLNSMKSNVGPLSEAVVGVLVSAGASGAPFIWKNEFSTAVPVMAGAKTTIVKLLVGPGQRAAEEIHRQSRGWDAHQGRALELQSSEGVFRASVVDHRGARVIDARLAAVTGWDVVRDVPRFIRAVTAAKVPFPKRTSVVAVPLINRRAESPEEIYAGQMMIKGTLRYRRFSQKRDSIAFDLGSEIGAIFGNGHFEPQLVCAGDGLKCVVT
jgi:hypothetical protein